MIRRIPPVPVALWALPFGLVALALASALGGLSPSFLDADESAHYVNALFLGDWLRAGLPSPIGWARDFYAHFPKLSIGHWPPGWYALLSPVWAVARPSPHAAILIAAFIAGLPAVLVVWALGRAHARTTGAVAGFAYLAIPPVATEAHIFRLDQPVTLVAGLAAIAWARAAAAPSLPRYLTFGALAAFAALTKGNGALAFLVPAFEIALAGRFRMLADRRLWIAAAATLAVVAPWYAVSFRISAGGFNYAPGPAYAALSLHTDAAALFGALGLAGLVTAVAGTVLGWRDAAARPVVRLALAVILATFVFQAAIPADIEPRYALPAVPWAVALAAIGIRAAALRTRAYAPVAAALALVCVVPVALGLRDIAPKPDIGAPAIAADMVAHPGIWLVDGRAGGEGAVIAAAAWADGGRRRVWAARASQWLSSSDFMGNGYVLTARTPGDARAVLDRLGVRGVVSIAEKGRLAWPHSAVLRDALRLPGMTVVDRRFVRGPGAVEIGLRTAPVAPHPDLLAPGSDRAAAMAKAL